MPGSRSAHIEDGVGVLVVAQGKPDPGENDNVRLQTLEGMDAGIADDDPRVVLAWGRGHAVGGCASLRSAHGLDPVRPDRRLFREDGFAPRRSAQQHDAGGVDAFFVHEGVQQPADGFALFMLAVYHGDDGFFAFGAPGIGGDGNAGFTFDPAGDFLGVAAIDPQLDVWFQKRKSVAPAEQVLAIIAKKV